VVIVDNTKPPIGTSYENNKNKILVNKKINSISQLKKYKKAL